MFFLGHAPFVIQYWKNTEIKTYLLITLRDKEKITDDPAVVRIIDYCKKLGVSNYTVILKILLLQATIEYLHNQTIPAGQFAQTPRTFAASTKFGRSLPDSAVFLTSDLDFFPGNIPKHVPDVKKKAKCCFMTMIVVDQLIGRK